MLTIQPVREDVFPPLVHASALDTFPESISSNRKGHSLAFYKCKF